MDYTLLSYAKRRVETFNDLTNDTRAGDFSYEIGT